MGTMTYEPLSVARRKTTDVQCDIPIAGDDESDTNAIRPDLDAPAFDAEQGALAQDADLEDKVEGALQEPEGGRALLRVHAENAGADDQTMTGHRSGHGLESLMLQMTASAQRNARRQFGPA